MRKASSIVGKSVLSLNDVCILGIIDGIFFDKKCKKTEYFTFSSTDGKNAVAVGDVLHVEDAAVVISKLKTVSISDLDTTALTACPVGKNIYNTEGNSKGQVDDVVLDDKLRVLALIVDGKEHQPTEYASIGEVLIIEDADAVKHRLRTKKPKLPAQNVSVSILPLPKMQATETPSAELQFVEQQDDEPSFVEQQDANPLNNEMNNAEPSAIGRQCAEPTNIEQDKIEQPAEGNEIDENQIDLFAVLNALSLETRAPERVISDYTFLLDRVLTEPLKTYAGRVLAPKGAKITPQIVDDARLNGKLVELTLNSK